MWRDAILTDNTLCRDPPPFGQTQSVLMVLSFLPQGSWAPSMNVPTLLTTIRLLMAHPNGDDGLMPDIVRLTNRDTDNLVVKPSYTSWLITARSVDD